MSPREKRLEAMIREVISIEERTTYPVPGLAKRLRVALRKDK